MKTKKYLGQHFLKSKFYLTLIAKSLDIKKEDIILEIGAGNGNLTKFLGGAKKIIAVEIDKTLAEELKRIKMKNLEIILEDIRKINLDSLIEKYKITKICGNIPYYLSGFLFRKILELNHFPETLVFLIQKEMAQKIVPKKNENFLSIAFKLIGKIKIISFLKKDLFFPKPKVNSAILKIEFLKVQRSLNFRKNFFKFLKLGFLHPNKLLISNLSKKYPKEKLKEIFKKYNFSLNLRAYHLFLKEWLMLFKEIQKI